MLIFFVEKVAFNTDHILHDHSKGGATNRNEPAPSPISSGCGAVILLGAFAVHSILETMALGLADTLFRDSMLLSFSIALHQVCLSPCH